MGHHSIAEAKARLADLITRARDGEAVVITEDGEPVAEIKPVRTKLPAAPESGAPMTEWLDWLRLNRIKGKAPREDAGTLVSRMRDEVEH